ncbi:hypothetical protein ROZALSC1DRAFT_30056, partial [Rozella allomycis CSF55]
MKLALVTLALALTVLQAAPTKAQDNDNQSTVSQTAGKSYPTKAAEYVAPTTGKAADSANEATHGQDTSNQYSTAPEDQYSEDSHAAQYDTANEADYNDHGSAQYQTGYEQGAAQYTYEPTGQESAQFEHENAAQYSGHDLYNDNQDDDDEDDEYGAYQYNQQAYGNPYAGQYYYQYQGGAGPNGGYEYVQTNNPYANVPPGGYAQGYENVPQGGYTQNSGYAYAEANANANAYANPVN